MKGQNTIELNQATVLEALNLWAERAAAREADFILTVAGAAIGVLVAEALWAAVSAWLGI